MAAFRSRLLAATTRHADRLLRPDGSVVALKGKAADGDEALAFYRLFEATGDPRYRAAALALAGRILGAMRATKFGVLEIKEKEKGDGETIAGGGPPAMGFYVSAVACILHREGGRADDLRYLAGVIDRFPWNESGWWASTIDVKTGESKLPMSKPAIINKTASVAMAAGLLSEAVRGLDPELSARLRRKVDRCVYDQILPAQLADGFWHYSLTENDPKNKDVLGYFMLTTHVLRELQAFNPAYREPRLDAALRRAQDFALRCIAPMTDPNRGPPCAAHATAGTPRHYSLAEEPKRGFQLGAVLLGGGHHDAGIKIMDAALAHFPHGNAGMDGAHAAGPSAAILAWLADAGRLPR